MKKTFQLFDNDQIEEMHFFINSHRGCLVEIDFDMQPKNETVTIEVFDDEKPAGLLLH